MLKKIFSILIMILLLVGLSGNVFAKDTYTATSILNGVTVNWKYEVNETNQIENLECTNPTDLVGNIIVPSTLDGKTVISLKFQAFKGATNITGVTLPNSMKEISYNAFEGCSNLTTVNLNKLESIGGNAFKDCPKLTQITIPKTLTHGNIYQHGPFSGTTKLTSVTFEEGCTTIPEVLLEDCTELTQITLPNTVSKISAEAFKGCTGITEITLPNSMKEISYNAFEGCSNLTTVNLNKLESIGGNAFKDCPKLTQITIPKTLTHGNIYQHGPFSGTTKLTSVTFEEGCTTIPEVLLEDCTELTQITLPNTVSKISAEAFKGCTGITEITLPNSMKEISYNAFEGCSNLLKITILDNCTNMGKNIFENHNQNLTIYCYKDSVAAKYAIDNKIKYVYLTKPTTDTDTDKKDEQNQQQKPSDTPNTNQEPTKKDDTTIATGKLPQTGATITGLFIILIISIASTIFYMKYRKFRDIK